MGQTVWNLLLGACWALAAGGATWYCVRLSTQITYVTLADGRRRERRLPALFRLLLPLAPNLVRLFNRPGLERHREALRRRIVAAGYEGLLTPDEFLALRVLVPSVVGIAMIVLMRLAFTSVHGRAGTFLLNRQFALYFMVLLVFALYPAAWLNRVLRQRHHAIEKGLPFVLDLLTLSVEAGLDFMTAIQRIVERRGLDALSEELIRVFREVLLGKTRKEALKSMAERVNQTDLTSVVDALVQADELGVSIGAMLRIQADQMRTRRFQRAEKRANEAPVKMLFPLMAFIFPAVFIVLLGPVLLDLIRNGF